MDSSVGRCLFQRRNERIDWRKLAAVDVEKIAREVDVDAIQENILNVTYCTIENEVGYNGLDANVIKLFRLAQLTIEYLLHSQEFLQQCMSEKDKKLESFTEQLNASVSQCGDIKDELSKRNDSYKNLKKELQKAKKLIGEYQFMVRAGASGLHRCASCTKSFVSDYYLRSHIERRHSKEVKRFETQQLPNVSVVQDETFQNDLNEIKSRLKCTEDELKREHENVYQLTLRESERNKEFAEILKKNELWKNEEQEQIKAEMEGYKKMTMEELKETQRENEELKTNLYNLQQSTEQWRKSALGNLEDDDGVDKVQYEDLKELTRQLAETCKEKEEMKKAIEKWKEANKKLADNNQKYEQLNTKVQKIELHFKREFDLFSNKYHDDLEDAKKICNEYIENVTQKNDLSTLNVLDELDTKPAKSPRSQDIEAGSVTLWVSSNISIMNCFKVSQKAASVKGEWNDLFSFRALFVPSDLFEKPIHVYSCGGSPYWRQYISLLEQPPSPNYKREFTFYGSTTKLVGTIKLFILDTGSGTVIRSMISRKESVEGWKEKSAYFYALKAGVSKGSVSRSYNSDVFRSISDDEVSLSSLSVADVARDNLAEALKTSRENLCDEIEEDKVEEFKNKSDSESESIDDTTHDSNEIVQDEREEENNILLATSSGSFLESTLPEKGQFYPFPNNRLAVARYNHTTKMINAQREEMIKILEDNLIKRGIDLDKVRMSSSVFDSKMRNHEKEIKLIEKQYPGFIERRKRLSKAVDDYATSNVTQKKKGKMDGKWKSVETVVKAAVRFSDDVTPIKKNNSTPLPYTDILPVRDLSNAVTSTPKQQDDKTSKAVNSQLDYGREDDSESSSDWNSDEVENQMIQSYENKTPLGTAGSNDMSLNDFASTGSTHQETYEHVSIEKQTVPKSTGNDRDVDLSDSSQWDSDELVVKDLQESPDVILSSTYEESYDQYDVYNPKMRPPTGEKVKELTASLEYTLGSRDPNKKKPAGAIDLHNL